MAGPNRTAVLFSDTPGTEERRVKTVEDAIETIHEADTFFVVAMNAEGERSLAMFGDAQHVLNLQEFLSEQIFLLLAKSITLKSRGVQ